MFADKSEIYLVRGDDLLRLMNLAAKAFHLGPNVYSDIAVGAKDYCMPIFQPYPIDEQKELEKFAKLIGYPGAEAMHPTARRAWHYRATIPAVPVLGTEK